MLIAAPPEGTEDLAALLRAELEALALEVIVVRGAKPRHMAPVSAVLHIQHDPRAVTAWTASTMRLRTYTADPRRLPGSDEMLARQVAEALRAELILHRKPSAGPPPQTPESGPPSPAARPIQAPCTAELPTTARPRPRPLPARVALAVTPTLTLSPGALPVLPQLGLDLQAYPWRGLMVKALAVLPFAAAKTTDPRGDLLTTTGMVGIALGYDLLGGNPFRLVPSAGAAWQWVRTVGRANPPFTSEEGGADLAYLFFGGSASYAVVPWLSLIAGARLGIGLPEPRFDIAGDDIGGFGRPAAQFFLGVAAPIDVDAR